MTTVQLPASPATLDFDPSRTALIVIDMQRDFLEPGGFGESLGNDVSLLQAAIGPCRTALEAARAAGMLIVHTREGHRPDLSDAPPAKIARGAPSKRISDPGPMGRILIRGEPGHEIVDALAPADGEPVIDKPGKGAFHQTYLMQMLTNAGIDTLMVAGVTTEVCVHTTIREGNDRGFRCVALGDACASYFPEFHRVGLEMIAAQGGMFGWVSDASSFAAALTDAVRAA
jgi:nicotinamidase-related amidase